MFRPVAVLFFDGVNVHACMPVSQEIWTLGNLDAASIFPRKFERFNFFKRLFFLRIYGRLRKFCRLIVFSCVF